MAKNIDFMGATFPDVPSIRLPQHEGGLVSFDDTSDGDITASDVTQGKIGYAQGQRVVGTATPSTPTIQSLSVTENGTYTAPSGVDGYSPVTVNVPGIVPAGSQTFTENGTFDVTSIAEAVINVAGGGGGGLEYETGTWTTTETITQPTINFSKTHSSVPIFAMIVDVTGAHSNTNAVLAWVYAGWFTLFGTATYSTESNPRYGEVACAYRGSTATINNTSFVMTTSPNDSASSGTTNTRYWINESAMKPGQGSVSRIFYPNHTYKWIAIWKPTT